MASQHQDVFEQYFRMADMDQDGRISGLEAVTFFQGANLPKITLAQIWQYADQGSTGFLSKQEFFAALRLVTVAQSGRELTPENARLAISGPYAASIAPPRIIQALPAPPTSSFSSGSVSSFGGASFQAQPRPQQAPTTSAEQGWGFQASQPSKPADSLASLADDAFGGNSFQVQSALKGAGVSPGQPTRPPAAAAPRPAAAPGSVGRAAAPVQLAPVPVVGGGSGAAAVWPAMTAADIARYTAVFAEVDTDRDGRISGEQARELFLSWQLPREVLKQIWELADEDVDSMLSAREFCTALYLMERFREGRPLPPVLPPGIHPPEVPRGAAPAPTYAASWSAQAQAQGPVPGQQPAGATGAMDMPAMADAPAGNTRSFSSKLPALDPNRLYQLQRDEQKTLTEKHKDAVEAEKKVWTTERDLMDSTQKMDFYRAKMQEIILFKSRCDNQLVEMTERVASEKRELEALMKKYDDKYKGAAGVNSRLLAEQAAFVDVSEKREKLAAAVAALAAGGDPNALLQERADKLIAELEEMQKAVVARAKSFGLVVRASAVEAPFGWQPGLQDGAAPWDESWDQFVDEGFVAVDGPAPRDAAVPLDKDIFSGDTPEAVAAAVASPAVEAAPFTQAPPFTQPPPFEVEPEAPASPVMTGEGMAEPKSRYSGLGASSDFAASPPSPHSSNASFDAGQPTQPTVGDPFGASESATAGWALAFSQTSEEADPTRASWGLQSNPASTQASYDAGPLGGPGGAGTSVSSPTSIAPVAENDPFATLGPMKAWGAPKPSGLSASSPFSPGASKTDTEFQWDAFQ